MKLTNLNIDISGIDAGQAMARALFSLKNMLVAAGFPVIGSGDGISRWACAGQTSPLAPGEQGDGGDYDCWQTPDIYATPGNPHAGSCWASRAWCVLQEPPGGKGRYLILQQTTGLPLNNSYGSYINIGINHDNDLNFAVCNVNTVPGIGSGRWLYGSANSNGTGIWYNATNLNVLHLFAYDDPQNEVFAWGLLAIQVDNLPRWTLGLASFAPDSPHLDADNDRCCYFMNTNTDGLSVSSFYRYCNKGLPNEQWLVAGSLGYNDYWRGGAPVDPRDGVDRSAKVQLYQANNSANEQYAGTIDRGVRMSGRPLAYPLIGRDQHGVNWVWVRNGVMFPWDDDPDPPTPL